MRITNSLTREVDVFSKGAVGTLRWTDIPDPTSKDAVTIRKKLEIANQRDLANMLKANFYESVVTNTCLIRTHAWLTDTRFKSEAIEESYNYFRDGIEYSIVRYRSFPDASTGGGTAPHRVLPALDETEPVGGGGWLVQVRAIVADDSTPDSIRAAHDSLVAAQAELTGVFDFHVFDRRASDTRVAPKISSTPIPLPPSVAGAVGGSRN